MKENAYPGPMTMVKIDGSKIKRLREQQGLTQLYLATAVEVTTDTISRWENKRYPSIKRENGIKLAEALGVELEELLDVEEVTPEESEPSTVVTPPPPEMSQAIEKKKPLKIWPLLILSSTLLCILFAFGYFYLGVNSQKLLEAVRVVPAHGISGQPIPVVIRVSEQSGDPTAMILTETVPDNASISNVFPLATGKEAKKRHLKWLGKITGATTYSYIIQGNSTISDTIEFHGKTAISGKEETTVGGQTKLFLTTYHWADENKDNIISDKEILTVYDKYSEVTGLEEEIDTVEEIWLGSGYKWIVETGKYEIFD